MRNRQSEAAECGLACLATILAYHGHRRDLASLRREHPVGSKGLSLPGLMSTADALGLSARPLRLDLHELGDLQLPCILHWDLNHFVVLEKVRRSRATIHDPARGKRELSFDEVSKHFTGVALELTPTARFEKVDRVERVRLSDLWTRVTGMKRSLVQLFLLAGLLQVFALAAPFYSQLVVDEAITKGDMGFLHVLAIGFALLLVIQTGIGVLRSYVGLHFATGLSVQMRVNLFRHLTRLPADFFEKRHIGDITSRFGSMGPVQGFFTSGIVAVVLDGFMAIATLAMILIYSWQLAAIVVGALVLHLLSRLAIFPMERRMSEEQLEFAAKENSLFLEGIRAARTVKLFGREADRMAVWQNAYADTVNAGLRISRFGIKVGVGSSLLFGIENIVVLLVGAKLVMDGQFTLGMLFAFQAYRSQFVGRTTALIDQLIAFRMLGLHLERLADIVHTPTEPGVDDAPRSASPLAGAIALKDVSFRYAAHEPDMLRGVDLDVRPGECIVITGPSGGGKSTLLKVLLGLVPPTAGELRVDGLPLPHIGLRAFRRQVGVITQDDVQLSGTIADNIAFFDAQADQARIEECARLARVHDDIVRMPMGYLSLVGDMGSSLSGGQKQRLFLARALYQDPRVLVLDEGTANLDMATEAAIIDLLAGLKITRIVVAHRPGVFAIADRLLVLDGGRLHEMVRESREPAAA